MPEYLAPGVFVEEIDSGSKPPVITAMAKYYFTELQRTIVSDGMDILAGEITSTSCSSKRQTASALVFSESGNSKLIFF